MEAEFHQEQHLQEDSAVQFHFAYSVHGGILVIPGKTDGRIQWLLMKKNHQ